MPKKFKIVSITQVFNEIEKDNLARFFKYLKPVVDEIVIYDDCSTDGSYEYALENANHVIRGFKNDFSNEIEHRNQLIQYAKKLNPDFILWIDADEVLSYRAKQNLQNLCHKCISKNYDAVEFHEINLWRSNSYKRIDSQFNDGWFVRLWRCTPNLKLESSQRGLHQKLYPSEIKKTFKQQKVFYIHFGFSSKQILAHKYLTYKKHGQSGYFELERLINERFLKLEKVDQSIFPKGLSNTDEKPVKLEYIDSLKYVYDYKSKFKRPKYSIVCLIYKSVEWLKLVHDQVNKYTDLDDKEFFFIANDANEDVINYLNKNFIKYYNYKAPDKYKNDWYINNVYRAWNYGAKMAKGDFILFINSDMCFSPGWFEALIKSYNGQNIISSRLVESGRLKSGIYGIEKFFGSNPSNYQEEEFIDYSNQIRIPITKKGGLYMPILIKRSLFVNIGGYPEGNLKEGEDLYSSNYALKGEKNISGDKVFIERLNKIGINHETSFESVVYHFQEGEMLSNDNKLLAESESIAIINDYCRGINGEQVLWNYLLDNIPGSYKIDKDLIKDGNFEKEAIKFIKPDTKIIIQNASFINKISDNHYTIMILQDNLRGMKSSSFQQENNLLKADCIVTNSIHNCASYPEFDFEIIPIGINQNLFKPKNKNKLRIKYGINGSKVGIFVGAMSEAKGWSKVKNCINSFPEINWIIVSKYNETFKHDNVYSYNSIDQTTLSELLNCADFFILGSPVETQCLAALEANLCDLPVIMPLVGIYKNFDKKQLDLLGLFSDDLDKSIMDLDKYKFKPRETILKKDITISNTISLWKDLIMDKISLVNNQTIIKNKVHINSKRIYLRIILEKFFDLKKVINFQLIIYKLKVLLKRIIIKR